MLNAHTHIQTKWIQTKRKKTKQLRFIVWMYSHSSSSSSKGMANKMELTMPWFLLWCSIRNGTCHTHTTYILFFLFAKSIRYIFLHWFDMLFSIRGKRKHSRFFTHCIKFCTLFIFVSRQVNVCNVKPHKWVMRKSIASYHTYYTVNTYEYVC